jgi:hypothetical protein
MHRSACTDLPLLHGLEHGSLCLRRRPIDFVSEKQIGEQRSRQESIGSLMGFRIFLNNLRAGHIARHHIRSELNSLELQLERIC